jgi:hypothetical protein
MSSFVAQFAEKMLERRAEGFQFLGADQLRPVLLDAAAGGDRDRTDRFAFRREKDKLATPVVRIRPSLDVAGALKLCDRLRRRLLAHASELGELADLNPFRGHEGEDVGVWWADIGETGRAQRLVDLLRVVLIEQTQEERKERAR